LTVADPRGLPPLRAAIARYLARSRGMRCAAEQGHRFNSPRSRRSIRSLRG
jgi:hypothetical protein